LHLDAGGRAQPARCCWSCQLTPRRSSDDPKLCAERSRPRITGLGTPAWGVHRSPPECNTPRDHAWIMRERSVNPRSFP
jgi:hypothetical protein